MISSVDPKLLSPRSGGENSHNFYPESPGNCLHLALVLLILYYFQTLCKCLKSAIVGVKWGGDADESCRQDRIAGSSFLLFKKLHSL